MWKAVLLFSLACCGMALIPSPCVSATIKGRVSPAGRCRGLRAVDRKMLKTYEGKYSIAKAGQAEKKMSDSAGKAAFDVEGRF